MEQDFLFQYRSINKFTILNLLNQELRLNSPKTFNDPYDGKLFIDDEQSKKLAINNIIKYLHIDKNNAEEFLRRSNEKSLIDKGKEILWDTAVEDSYVSCFSEEYKSILMWSHYSEYHRGICIKYNKKDLDSFSKISLKNVAYIDERESITAEMIEEACEMNNEQVNEILNQSIFTKSKCWEYEKEWRLVYFKDDKESIGDGFNVKSPKPVAIYMGTNIKKEDRIFVENLCKERNIKLYQMKMKKDKFELEEEFVEL